MLAINVKSENSLFITSCLETVPLEKHAPGIIILRDFIQC